MSLTSRAPDMLSNIFSTGRAPGVTVIPRGMIPMKARTEAAGDFVVVGKVQCAGGECEIDGVEDDEDVGVFNHGEEGEALGAAVH